MYGDDDNGLGIGGIGIGAFGDDEADCVACDIIAGLTDDDPEQIGAIDIGALEDTVAEVLRDTFGVRPTTREVGAVIGAIRDNIRMRREGRKDRREMRGDGRKARGEFRVLSRQARKHAKAAKRQARKNEKAGLSQESEKSRMEPQDLTNRGQDTTVFKALNGGKLWRRTGGRIWQPLGTFTVPANLVQNPVIGGSQNGQSAQAYEFLGLWFSVAQGVADCVNTQDSLIAGLEISDPQIGVLPMYAQSGGLCAGALAFPMRGTGAIERTGWVIADTAGNQFKATLSQVKNAAGNAGVLGADVRVNVMLIGNYVEPY